MRLAELIDYTSKDIFEPFNLMIEAIVRLPSAHMLKMKLEKDLR